jgi:hypothetical protein
MAKAEKKSKENTISWRKYQSKISENGEISCENNAI